MLDKARNQGTPREYLRNQNVRWFGFDLSDVNVMGFTSEEEAKYTAIKGDVLICEGGNPGRAAIWEQNEPVYFQKALHRVRFQELGRNKWFVYYLYMKSLDGTLRQHFSGTGIQHFTGEALGQFEVPTPPLGEQQRIVGLLDEAFESIDLARVNAEKSLQSARALFVSQLQSVLSQDWSQSEWRSLGDVCRTSSGGTPLKSRREYYEGGTIPWLMSGEVAQGEVRQATRFITKMGLDDSSAKLFPPSTVLVAMYGATAGQVGVLRFEAATNQAVCGVLPTEFFAPEFLYYFLLSRQEALVAQATGNAQPNISQAKIRSMAIPLLRLSQQETIVEGLHLLRDETVHLATIYQRKLTALDELKQSLLHQAFSGNL